MKKSLLHPVIIGFVSLLIALPSLNSGLASDDFVQIRFFLETRWYSLSKVLSEMYATLSPHFYQGLLSTGDIPWFANKHLTIAFYRPIAALSALVDYNFFLNSPLLMHLHSVVWYVIVCLTVYMFYRRFLKNLLPAFFAGLLFSVDVNHLSLLTWLVSRNRLIMLFFAVLTLLFHHRWRKERSYYYSLAASGAFTLMLLSSEAGLAVFGYLIAYAFFMEKVSFKKRVVSLLPYILITAVWKIYYKLHGFGILFSNHYTDPFSTPFVFLKDAVLRTPVLFAEQWFNISAFLPVKYWVWADPSVYNISSPSFAPLFTIICAVMSLLIFFLFLPLLKKSRIARFLFFGMTLSIIASTATGFISGRLLTLAGVGAFGLMALFFEERKNWLSVGIILIIIHGIISPVQLAVYGFMKNPMQTEIEMLTDLPFSQLKNKNVVVLTTPSFFHFSYRPTMQILENGALPQYLRVISSATHDIKVERFTGNRFTLTDLDQPPDGNSSSSMIHKAYAYRRLDQAYYTDLNHLQGQTITLFPLIIKPELSNSGQEVSKITVQFFENLQSDPILWYVWDWKTGSYKAFDLPPVGKSIIIKGLFTQ